jgi:hypothetical protein
MRELHARHGDHGGDASDATADALHGQPRPIDRQLNSPLAYDRPYNEEATGTNKPGETAST